MRTLSLTRALAPVAAALALAAALPSLAAQDTGVQGKPTQAKPSETKAVEEFTASAINVNSGQASGTQRPSTARLTIRIERWTTDKEKDALLAVVKEGGGNVNRTNQQLLAALQGMPRVGTIRESTSLAWDLRFARQGPLEDGGRRLVIATDRPMPFWEIRGQPRSADYPFTLLEMHLDKEHRGEGKLLADTRIFIDQRTNDLVLEHYELQPVRLNDIRRRS